MSIYKKLLKVKEAAAYIKKDAQAQYSYASPSAVLGKMNPLLIEHQLLLKSEVLGTHTERITYEVWDKINKRYRAKTETLFTLDMRMTWVDAESGEMDVNLWSSSGCNGEEKGYGSALTYGERYFMLKYFNIATDDDDPDNYQAKYVVDKAPKETPKPAAAPVEVELTAAQEMGQENLITDGFLRVQETQTLEQLEAVHGQVIATLIGIKAKSKFKKYCTEQKVKISKV